MVPTPLLRPDEYFAERAPGLSLARAGAVVLLVAIVSTAVVGAFGWTLSQQLTATTQIENDARPPDWVCDDHGATGGETETTAETAGEATTETGTETTTGFGVDGMMREACDQPKQRTVVVGDLLWDAFSERLPLVFVGVLLGWPLYAVGLHVASAMVGGRGSFLDTLAVAGWGMLPGVAQAVVGLGLLYTALGSVDLAASNPEVLASQIRSLSRRSQGDTALLSLAGACWQGYVWTFGLKRARDLSTGAAAFAGGGVAFVAFLLSLV